MRKKILTLLVLLAGLAPAAAQVPFPQSLPPSTIVGRMPPASGPAQAIPFAVFNNTVAAGLLGFTTNGDSDFSIPSTARVVATTAALTAPRTWTLPLAAALAAGQQLCVIDQAGGVTSTNTLTFARAGADTINGVTSIILKGAFSGQCLLSDGASKWTSVPAIGTLTNHGVVLGQGASPVVATAAGTSGQCLVSGGAGADPTFQTVCNSLVINVQRFTATGTYTPTASIKYAIIECVGGGGSGAGGTGVAAGFIQGGGGGSGGWSRAFASAATIGASQAVTIGPGGTAPAAGNNNGTVGTDTSVGALCIGKGGTGGNFASGGQIGTGGLGGVAGTGNALTATGSYGFTGMYNNASATTVATFGNGGSTPYGAGAPANTQSGAGTTVVGIAAAANTGGGGGGGNANATTNTFAGGNGGSGLVIVTEYIQ